ncbi:hypothetical protein ACFW04_005647 [Cataglyphis niger]
MARTTKTTMTMTTTTTTTTTTTSTSVTAAMTTTTAQRRHVEPRMRRVGVGAADRRVERGGQSHARVQW